VLERPEPVAFALERNDGQFRWITDRALVATAVLVDGLWQLHDARSSHVVTLVPIGDGPGTALVGPDASLLGRIRATDDGGSAVIDPEGRAVLVLRPDGSQGAHLVDRRGEVVAMASWEDPEAATDLLVTAHGTGQSLAMVFGVFLSLELERHSRRTA
jgi:hypothetical protein